MLYGLRLRAFRAFQVFEFVVEGLGPRVNFGMVTRNNTSNQHEKNKTSNWADPKLHTKNDPYKAPRTQIIGV